MVLVAELAIGLTVLGFFVAPNISRLMERAREFASNKYELHTGKVEKLLKLAQDLEEIKGYLDPASIGGFVNDQTWLDRLWRLKDTIHDAEEILDLFESHILEQKAAKNLKKHRGGASSSKKTRDTSSSEAPSLDQLDSVLKNLADLRGMAQELRQNPNTRNHVPSHISGRSAGTGQDRVRDKELFFGYDDEYNKLVSMLLDGNIGKKVIAIIGHGGMGKTELARQAFRDVEADFDRLIWMPAYGKKTEFEVLAEIWKSVVGSKSVDEMNISSLQRMLKERLSSNKCLLVLDDVWNNESAIGELERGQAWEGLPSLLGDGSKIVMTTRAKICSTTLGAYESIILNGIKPKDIKLLVNHTAMLRTDGSQRKIQNLLNGQVLKFKGSPLAAVEIGLELKAQKTRLQRCNILNDMENHLCNVFNEHLCTYHHLPPHLQRCFAFCSIFPDNWRFEPGKLTKMWIALGFVEEGSHGLGGTRKSSAGGYFDSLVDRSLFQLEEACGSSMGTPDKADKKRYYVIHEQIHWMLRIVSAKNCISISPGSISHRAGAGSSKRSIPTTVRHLSVTSGCLDQLNQHSIGLGNLRTLLVLKDDDGSNPAPSIDKTILEEFKGVRVLDLSETGITQLPENIGKLKHVRYLGLPGTISSSCPCDEVNKLLLLQTLSVRGKKKKEGFISNIGGIGRLSKLQESIKFKVTRGSEKEGHGLWELAEMNSLGEKLTIKGLEAVASKKEAEEAQLGEKDSVKILKLKWEPPKFSAAAGSSAAAAADPAGAVLEGLQPHRYLNELRIARYPGELLHTPTWLSGLETMTRLYLKNCRKLKALPALGGLQALELLVIKELTSVERIKGDFCGGGAFPKLKKIVLEDMRVLVAWDDMPGDAFPVLSDVSIVDCPELSSLAGLGCCGGSISLSVSRCRAITLKTLPAKFSDGVSTCKFH